MNTQTDFPKSLEDYKSAVYDYLTQTMRISTAVAQCRMNDYEEDFQEFWENKLPVSGAATGMMTNLLKGLVTCTLIVIQSISDFLHANQIYSNRRCYDLCVLPFLNLRLFNRVGVNSNNPY